MRPLLLLLGLLALAPTASAAEDTHAGDGLTARQIYDKVLTNRFERFRQEIRLISGDRAENAQESRMTVLWKSFRDENGQPRKGVLSKTMVRYTHPFDLRFSGYLVINNADRLDDQFVYLASRRRTRRVNLRGEPVLGSDFSFEDVIPHELEDADYKRLADAAHDGRPCFVIEIYPKPEANSEYAKLESWIDRERFVVLRTQYWNKDDVLIKELDAPAAEVKEFGGIWIPMHSEMRNLVSESWSKLYIDKLEANPDVPDTDFDPRKLESH
jgi:outer membrane lipoprotein-sorting protein